MIVSEIKKNMSVNICGILMALKKNKPTYETDNNIIAKCKQFFNNRISKLFLSNTDEIKYIKN